MRYACALMSVMAGIGFVARVFHARMVLLSTAIILALFALLMLIGQLAIPNFENEPDIEALGGILAAPATSLGFLFVGTALWLSGGRPFLLRPLVLGMLGSSTIMLASITLTGYLVDAHRMYGWAHHTRMAAQVVIVLMASGAAIIALGSSGNEHNRAFSWRPLLASVSVLGATLALWLALVHEQNGQIERAVSTEAERVKAELSWQLEPRILALMRMALRWEHFEGASREDWELDAVAYMNHQAGYRSIQWIDSSLRLQWIVPAINAAERRGRVVVTDEEERRKLGQARIHWKAVLLYRPGPEKALYAFIPVRDVARSFAGFISGVFDTSKLLDHILAPHLANYGVSVFLGEEQIYRHADDSQDDAPWGQEVALDLHDLNLRVRVWPNYATLAALRSPIPWMVLGFGFVLAVLLLWAVYLLETSRARALQIARVNRVLTDEIEVRRQTEAQLSFSQVRYRSLFDSIRDAIVVADRDNFIVSCNPAFSQLFGYTAEEVHGLSSDAILENASQGEELRNCLDDAQSASIRTVSYKRKTGETFVGETGFFYLRASDQKILGYVKLIRDVTERERAAREIERRTAYERLLHAVASAANWAVSIEEVARTAIDLLCSVSGWPVGYFYEVLPEGGGLASPNVWHAQDVERFRPLHALLSSQKLKGDDLPGRVLDSGQAQWMVDLVRPPISPCSKAALTAGMRSAMAFPILVHADIVGVALFFSPDRKEPELGQLDALAQVMTHVGRTIERVRARENIERLNHDLERRVAQRTRQLSEMNAELEIEIAERERLEQQLENALAQEREARFEAEAAQSRLAFLADATVKLSASLDHRVTLDTLANLAVPYLADWCAIDSLEPDGTYALTAAAHSDPDKKQLIYEFAGENLRCHAEAIASKRVCCESGRGAAGTGGLNGALNELGFGSCICVPLLTAERVVGVLSLLRVRPDSHFTAAERQLAEELARRAALAMDHAELYRAAQEEIAERRRAEESLVAESGRLAVTLQSIGDGVITTDVDGRIALINSVAETLTGWRASEAIGRPLEEVFCLEARHKPDADRTQRIMQSGSALEFEGQTLLRARDGTRRMIADSGASIRDSSGSVIGAVLVFRDITEQQRMEEDLIKAQKLDSIGLLAGGIAHDFNNILTAILGNISLARTYSEEGSQASEVLAEAEKAFWRARELTQQLLTFARGGAPVRKTAKLNEFLTETVRFALRGGNTQCIFDIDPGLRPVSYDAGQMSQVFNNLVINASQAMPNGGLITVAGRNVTLTHRQLGVLPAGDYVRITVIDQGAGIAEENLLRIFDPYFTTKPGGTGLGLATAYSIIRRHDGHICVDSHPDEGSQFHVYLPASPEAIREETMPDAPNILRGQGKILVMDDDPAVREVAARLLRSIGYYVAEAGCGDSALKLYKDALETGHRFDAVILDLTVPGGIGGRECVRLLLEIDPTVRAIVSSGYSNDPIMAECGSHGFRAIVSKPYQLRELADSVSRVLSDTN